MHFRRKIMEEVTEKIKTQILKQFIKDKNLIIRTSIRVRLILD
jgi:predicted XRE-type DNA-binding protein